MEQLVGSNSQRARVPLRQCRAQVLPQWPVQFWTKSPPTYFILMSWPGMAKFGFITSWHDLCFEKTKPLGQPLGAFRESRAKARGSCHT